MKESRRCQQCTQGRIIRKGDAHDGRPQYGCTNCNNVHTRGHAGYAWDTQPKRRGLDIGRTIEPGCWVATRWGKAVCTDVRDNWVGFRYRAIRSVDQREIWVANGDSIENVRFMKPPTRFTARVVKLTGPYGEGQPDP